MNALPGVPGQKNAPDPHPSSCSHRPHHPPADASRRPRNRGTAALAITLLLFFVMALVAVFVNRNLIFEQRIAANQYRSTQAFEAAEAGLQWAEAQLNANQRIGSDCLASHAAAADSFRERYLAFTAATGRLTPRTTAGAGGTTTAQPGAMCVRRASAWACSCPGEGLPAATLAEPVDAGRQPAFRLELIASDRPGTVRVVATGCSSLAPPCLPGGINNSAPPLADATSHIEVTLGLLSAPRVPPAAALTTAGAVDTAAAFTARNVDAATGLAVHAGAAITAPLAQLQGPAGAPAAASRFAGDTAMAGLSADAFFAAYFGLGKARWQSQPTVTRVVCSSDCAGAIAQAVADRASSAMIWVEGDVDIAGPVTLGTPARPVVVVVDGALGLHGAVDVVGVLYAASLRWDDAASGARVLGATLSAGDYRGNATPAFAYDSAVLATLTGFAGSFARVSGSWRDF